MSEQQMQRYSDTWIANDWFLYNNADPIPPPRETRFYVLASDAEAAIAAAKQTLHRAENAWREEIRTRLGEQYEQGQRDMLARVVEAVEALSHETCGECCEVDVVAALRRLDLGA